MVLLDLSEGAAKGGAMDLEIFALPNVEISKGTGCHCRCGSWCCTVCACACLSEIRAPEELQKLQKHTRHVFKKMLPFHSFLLFPHLPTVKLVREGSVKLELLLFQALLLIEVEVSEPASRLSGFY